MSATIKFRGKGTNTGKYYYGYYYEDNGTSVILRIDGENLYHTKVIPASVQQFIGYDKSQIDSAKILAIVADNELVSDTDTQENISLIL